MISASFAVYDNTALPHVRSLQQRFETLAEAKEYVISRGAIFIDPCPDYVDCFDMITKTGLQLAIEREPREAREASQMSRQF